MIDLMTMMMKLDYVEKKRNEKKRKERDGC